MNITESVLATCRRQRQLGRELRRIYGDILEESVPDDMLRLLNDIDSAAPRTPSNSSADEPD